MPPLSRPAPPPPVDGSTPPRPLDPVGWSPPPHLSYRHQVGWPARRLTVRGSTLGGATPAQEHIPSRMGQPHMLSHRYRQKRLFETSFFGSINASIAKNYKGQFKRHSKIFNKAFKSRMFLVNSSFKFQPTWTSQLSNEFLRHDTSIYPSLSLTYLIFSLCYFYRPQRLRLVVS